MEALLIGRLLAGRYRIDEPIGSGGMGVVFRATDTRLGREVAVKVVSLPPGSESRREELRLRLRREAASAAQIPSHPNVVQVYDYGTDAELDLDFIVMELLRGRDLKTAMQEGGIEHQQAMRILREAARGLAAGHRAGIVHRDVKPANLALIGEDRLEAVKILDFGIAKALEVEPDAELTRTLGTPHSPAYASPEQLRAREPLTPASDVYQLGLVAYELLAGERPYGEAEREQLRAGGEPPIPALGRWSAVPPSVRAVVQRALSVDPSRRYPDGSALAEALSAAEAEETQLFAGTPPPDATRTAPHVEPPEPSGGSIPSGVSGPSVVHGGRRLMIAAAAGALLLLLVVLLARGGDEPAPVPPPAGVGGEGMDALDREFRALTRDAYEALRREASMGPEAAAAVESVVRALSQSWVEGDLSRHLALYADEVAFYGQHSDRDDIAALRERSLERYPERRITLRRVAIEFPQEGEARALIDKEWELRGGDRSWSGAARQELRLRQTNGRWRVTAERDLEVFRSNRG